MFIAHLPASYIVSRVLLKQWPSIDNKKEFLMIGMCGGIFPDFDLFYFYFVDHQQHHHHSYLTHYPLLWLILLIIGLLWKWKAGLSSKATLFIGFALNGFIHILLDTVVGDIWWLFPFNNQPFALFNVSPHYQPWWLNFLLHWSFLLEILITLSAIYLWYLPSKQKLNS